MQSLSFRHTRQPANNYHKQQHLFVVDGAITEFQAHTTASQQLPQTTTSICSEVVVYGGGFPKQRNEVDD